jgi:hypothetical protein
MDIQSKAKVKRATLDVVVIRADGTREPLGVVSYYHRNPIYRLAFAVRLLTRRLLHGTTHQRRPRDHHE